MDNKYTVKLRSLVESVGMQIVNRPTNYDEIVISAQSINRPGIQLAGFYDYFDADRIQLMGKVETAYLQGFTTDVRREKLEKLMQQGIPALIVCHNVELMPECLEAARKYNVTLLKTKMRTEELMVIIVSFLKDKLAPRITRHGVLIEVYGEGVFITGESGLGKSEAALELIKRGHRLISDDAVEIKKTNSKTLVGSSPELIQNYIELRGIGVVDVRQIFGAHAVKRSERIDIIVALEEWDDNAFYDRIGAETKYTNILDVEIPTIQVPVRPGRNLAVIIEVAAMNNKQKRYGNDAAAAFSERIDKYFNNQEQG